jgi:hypothetical protein
MHTETYKKPAYPGVFKIWGSVADAEGCAKAALPNRWVVYKSQLEPKYVDGVLLGANS